MRHLTMFLLFVFVLCGCPSSDSPPSVVVVENGGNGNGAGIGENMVWPEVRKDLLVSTDWVARNSGKSTTIIVEVGSVDSYNQGHIPKALHLGWSEVAVAKNGIPNELPASNEIKLSALNLGMNPNSRVVFYDKKNGLLAARAFFAFDSLGIMDTTLSLMDGGWGKWVAEGKETSEVRGVGKAKSALHRKSVDVVATMQQVKDWLPNKETGKKAGATLIDSRAGYGYSMGHIPGAKHVVWKDNLDGAMHLPVETLRKQFAEAGVTMDKPVVTYCGSGVQAAHTYFTLKYLGFNPKLYDGSMSEWNAHNNPTE